MRTHNHHLRGLSLIELTIAMAVGAFIIAAAFAFVTHQTRLFEFTRSELDRDRTGRLALDLLVEDLRLAGLGVGYDGSGNFAGLMLGSFTVQGGATFSNDYAIQVAYGANPNNLVGQYTITSDDIGIRFANGAWRSIPQYFGTSGQVCSGSGFQANDIVLLLAEDGFTAKTVKLTSIAPAGGCSFGTCVNGCDDFTFTADASYASSSGALTASYVGGEMGGAYKTVVWFVDTTGADSGSADLRRAEVTAQSPCAARDQTCGQRVAYDVESVQMAVLQWDPTTSAWVDQTAAQAITDRRRVRLDLEMVVRTRSSEARVQDPIQLQLEPTICAPAPCGARDQIGRRALRTSVEVRNSGRMQLQALAR